MKTKIGSGIGWFLLAMLLAAGRAGAQTPPESLSVSNQIVVAGTAAVFGVSVAGTGPFTYQWLYDGVPISVSNIITTVAGNTNFSSGYSGDGGAATNAGLWYPAGVTVDGAGNFYIADQGNKVIRKVDAGGNISTVAGNYTLGGTYVGDGEAATNAGLSLPNDIVADGWGNLYIADSHNNVIRRVDGGGVITTVAGDYNLGGTYSGDGGAATGAGLFYPNGVAVDGAGNLYIAENGNNVIRKVDTNNIITTVAGNYNLGGTYWGDGGAATNAGLWWPNGVAVDGAGNLYIADTGNQVIRKVDTNNIITTVAGNYNLGAGYSGDGVQATNAALNSENGVAVDGWGNVYIADTRNNVVREVDASGVITTVAGNFNLGGGYSGDGGAATNAALKIPIHAGVDEAGNLYIADADNGVIRKVAFANFSGAISNGTLTIPAVQTNVAGNYQLIVSNPYGSLTSSIVSLTVIISPVITRQPTSQAAVTRDDVVFTVTATGLPAPSYQWFFSGTNLLVGATNAALTLADVQNANAGWYSVVVSNLAGSVASSNTSLTVLPPCDPAPAGVVSWWPGGGTNDIIGTNNAVWINGASDTNTTLGTAYYFAGNEPPYNYLSVADSPSLDSFTSAMTVEFWFQNFNPAVTEDGFADFIGRGDSYWTLWARGPVYVYMPQNGVNFQGNMSVMDGNWHHIAVTFDENAATVTLYVDGAVDKTSSCSGDVQNGSQPLCIGADGGYGSGRHLFGMLTQVTLYNTVLTQPQVQAIYAAGAGGKCTGPVAPVIITQPVSQTNYAGATAVLSVTAGGTAPLGYQWSFAGTSLAGATNAVLTLANVQPANAGGYTVVVSNLLGSAASSNAVLTVVTQPPVIITQPVSQTNYAGATAVLSVTAGGTAPLGYQWSFAGTSLAGATNAVLTLADVQADQAGSYSVQVANAYGATNSVDAELTVNLPPPCDPAPAGVVSWWPGGGTNDIIGTNNAVWINGASDTNTTLGTAYYFAGNEPPYNYLSVADSPSLDSFTSAMTVEFWFQNFNPAVTEDGFADFIGRGDSYWTLWARGPVYVYMPQNGVNFQGNMSVMDGNWHHIAVTFDENAATVTLYVDGAVDKTSSCSGDVQNGSQPLCIGADGGYGSGRHLFGMLTQVTLYNTVLTQPQVQAIYAAGAGGKCTGPVAPVIITQPVSQTNYAGATAVLSVTAGGTAPLGYQWSFAGTSLAGATNAVLTLANVQPANAGGYTVVVSNLLGSAASSNAVLTVVTQPPVIITQPVSQTNYAGATAVLSVTAGGTAPLGYQWSFAGTSLAGATNAVLTLADVQADQAGSYSVQVANAYGATNSVDAELTVNLPPPCDPAPAGVVSWWPGGGTNDIIGTNNAVWINGASDTNTTLGTAYYFAGNEPPYNYLSVADSPSLDSFTSAMTVEFWFQNFNPAVTEDGFADFIGRGDSYWTLWARGPVYVYMPQNGVNFQGNMSVMDGNWHHIAVTFDENAATVTLYVDGAVDKTSSCSGDVQNGSQPLCIGADGGYGSGRHLFGMLTQVTLYNTVLTQPQVQAIYAAGAGGKCTGPVAPVIITQPVSQTNYAGATAVLSVTAGGTAPLGYQWSFAGTSLAGATNAVLTLANVQPANAGGYTVVVSNLLGSAASSNAVLTVVTQPPVIITQPVSQTNYAGATAVLSVTAGGTAPLGYQWSFAGTSLAGATNAVLTLADVQADQAGSYSVQVANAYGATNSVDAELTVNLPPPCDPAPAGVVSWWPGGGTNDIIGPNNGAWNGTAAYTNGVDSQAFFFCGPQAGGYVIIPDSPSLDALTNQFSIEFWYLNLGGQGSDFAAAASKGDGAWSIWIRGSVYAYMNNGGVNLYGNTSVSDGRWHHVAVCWDGGTVSIYVDGNLDRSAGFSGPLQTASAPLLIGSDPDDAAGRVVNGCVNQLTIYHAGLTQPQVQAIYAAGAGGKCTIVWPTIAAQPTNQTVIQGSPVTFSVAATGGDLYYQWWFNGTPLRGAASATLTLSNAQSASAGTYHVSVTNPLGSVSSSNAVLTVIAPPLVTAQPTNQAIAQGTNVIFGVTAAGGGLNYQWWLNETNPLAGATNATLMLTDVQLSDAGVYTVVVTNLAGSVTSSNAVLLVLMPPAITGQPTNLTVLQGSPATFGVTATGGDLNYQWWFNGTNLLARATNAVLTLTNAQPANAGGYTVIVSNLAGLVTSSNAVLTVHTPPSILVQPYNQVAAVGGNATFSVTATGGGLNYQWWFDGNPLSGETGSTLTLDDVQAACAMVITNIHVVITNFYGSATSASAMLTIVTPPAITGQPTNEMIVQDNNAEFGVTATGGALSYQWWFDGTNLLAGATNAMLMLTDVQPYNTGIYSVVVTNAAGAVISTNVMLTVLIPPTITTPPNSQTIKQYENVEFSVAATGGNTPYAYQWYFNGACLPGATNFSLSITNVQTNNSGAYSVSVTGCYGGSVTSAPALLTVLVLPYAVPAGLVTNFVFQSDTTYFVDSGVVLYGNTTVEGGTVIKFSTNGSLNLQGPLTCLNGPYRPVLLTSKDDNTAGAIIEGSSGQPVTSGAGIYLFDGGGQTNAYQYLRCTYADTAILGANPVNVWDSQFVQCGTAVGSSGGQSIALHNVLVAESSNCVCTTGSVAAEFLTADQCDNFCPLDYDGAWLTNSILTGVTNSTGMSLVSSISLASGAGVYQVAGGGNYYLAANTYQQQGAMGVSPQSLADVAGKTTWPPIIFQAPGGGLGTNVSFSPQARRDANTPPDLGYHYDPLDYMVSTMMVTNATISVSAGTALACYGTEPSANYGVAVSANARLACLGTPNNPVWMVAYNTVQEETPDGWLTPMNGLAAHLDNSLNYQITTRFTDWSAIAQDDPLIQADWGTNALCFHDSEFHGGQFISWNPTVDLTNCLLERVSTCLTNTDGNAPWIQNCTFRGGTFNFAPNVGTATVEDTLFDSTSIPNNAALYGAYNGGYNGYVTGGDRLSPTNGGDIILTAPPCYQSSILGRYYLPPGSPLLNAGSTTANLLGLYHYTTRTNQVVQGDSVVDIGYHYVALEPNGLPLDSNGDGIPDYLEDANGDGIFDAGDPANWQTTSVLAPTAVLQVFTPLQN